MKRAETTNAHMGEIFTGTQGFVAGVGGHGHAVGLTPLHTGSDQPAQHVIDLAQVVLTQQRLFAQQRQIGRGRCSDSSSLTAEG